MTDELNTINEQEEQEEQEENTSPISLNDDIDSKLTKQQEDLTKKIINENDPDKFKDLLQVFNLFNAKKQVVRSVTLGKLIDNVSEEMMTRLSLDPDKFSNKDLVDFLKTSQSSYQQALEDVSKANNSPLIIKKDEQDTSVKVNGQSLSRNSIDKILDVLGAILNTNGLNQDNVIDADIVNKDEDDEEEEDD